MARKRSAAVLVIAILNLAGGVLGLAATGCAGVSLASDQTMISATPPPPPPTAPGTGPPSPAPNFNVQQALVQRIPAYLSFRIGEVAVNLLLDVLLFASGIGLLLQHRWAWALALVYAILSVLAKVAVAAFYFGLVYPTTMDYMEEQARVNPWMGTTLVTATRVSFLTGMLFKLVLVAYPATLLVLLLLPSVRAAFRDPPLDEGEEEWEDPYDEDAF
jgi:hypothetical protein